MAGGLYGPVEPVAAPLRAYLIRRTHTVDTLTVLRQSVLAAQHRGDHRREAELLLPMRRQYWALGRRREAQECAEAGHLARIPLGVRSPEVDDEFGKQAAERGDHEAARYHLQRAALAWRRRRDAPRSAASFSALGQALEALGHFAEATRAYTGAAARAEAAGDLVAAAYAYLRLASCAAHGHQRDFDVVQLRQVLEVAREAGDLRATIEALELLAVAEIQAGQTPAAAPLLEEAIGLAATHRLPLLLNRLLRVELELRQLEAIEAEAAALRAWVERLPTPTPPRCPSRRCGSRPDMCGRCCCGSSRSRCAAHCGHWAACCGHWSRAVR